MLMIIGTVLLLVAAVLGLVIVINAFKESAGQGLLCMFVPFYILYYAFGRYRSPRKAVVVGGWLGALALGATLQIVGLTMAASDAVAAFDAEMANLPELAAPPTAGETAGDPLAYVHGGYRCDLRAQQGTCEEPSETNLVLGVQFGESACTNRAGDWAAGTCPHDNRLGACLTVSGGRTHYYANAAREHDAASAARDCANIHLGTWTAAE